jgi:flagellar motor switch/type III secretory pathway protein FliN
MANQHDLSQDEIDKLMSEDAELDQDWGEDAAPGPAAAAKKAEPAPSHAFESFPAPGGSGAADSRSLDFILDIPLEVSVELGGPAWSSMIFSNWGRVP